MSVSIRPSRCLCTKPHCRRSDVSISRGRSHVERASSSSLTRFGFALPAAAFITWPTRNPKVAVLPPRYCATASAFCASTSAISADDLRLVVDLRQAFGRDDRRPRVRPDANIFSNTSFAIAPLIVPFSTSASSPASRSRRDRRRRDRRRPLRSARARARPSSSCSPPSAARRRATAASK